jgi:hypothetical protein
VTLRARWVTLRSGGSHRKVPCEPGRVQRCSCRRHLDEAVSSISSIVWKYKAHAQVAIPACAGACPPHTTLGSATAAGLRSSSRSSLVAGACRTSLRWRRERVAQLLAESESGGERSHLHGG